MFVFKLNKTIVIATLLSIMVAHLGISQNLVVSTYMELPHTYIIQGYSIGYTPSNNSQLETGIFFQSSLTSYEDYQQKFDDLAGQFEKKLYGIYLQVPFELEYGTLYANVKIGHKNNQTILVIPSIITSTTIGKHFRVGGGLAYRDKKGSLNLFCSFRFGQ